jgi:hypothetical protein
VIFNINQLLLIKTIQFSARGALQQWRNLGINPNIITRWIEEYQQNGVGQALHGNGKLIS